MAAVSSNGSINTSPGNTNNAICTKFFLDNVHSLTRTHCNWWGGAHPKPYTTKNMRSPVKLQQIRQTCKNATKTHPKFCPLFARKFEKNVVALLDKALTAVGAFPPHASA